MRRGVGVWPRVMKRENKGLCNGRRRERCTVGVGRRNEGALQWLRERAQKRLEEREKMGRKISGPSNGNKTGTY